MAWIDLQIQTMGCSLNSALRIVISWLAGCSASAIK